MKFQALFATLNMRAELVDRMAKAVGARQGLLSNPSRAAVTRRAVERCGQCAQTDACQHWLDSNPTADHAPDYCRNRDLFDRLTRDIEADLAPQS